MSATNRVFWLRRGMMTNRRATHHEVGAAQASGLQNRAVASPWSPTYVRQLPPRTVKSDYARLYHAPKRRNKRESSEGNFSTVPHSASTPQYTVPMAVAQTVKRTSASVRRLLYGAIRRVVASHGAVFVGFVVLAAFWLRPLTWHMANHITGPGDPLTTAWRVVWPAQWLIERPAPFWQTNVLYPATNVFARDELTLGESLFAGPLYIVTHNALLAYNLTLLLTLALSGFFIYCLAWHCVRSRTAGVIAGIVFAFAPYHLAQIDHAGLLAVQWLPLVVLFADRVRITRSWRDGALLGGCALLQALSAGYYAYWTAAVVVAYLGYVALFMRNRISLAGLRIVATSLLIAVAALIPVVLPFWRVARADGFARPMREVEYWSARPQTWLAATPDNLLYSQLVRDHAWTGSREMYLFPGAVAIVLSVVAVCSRKSGSWRWFGLALAVLGFVLSLGPVLHLARRDQGWIPLPYGLLYRFIPGGDALRAPVRAAPIAMLGIALLAAVGWDECAKFVQTRRAAVSVTPILASVLCILLLGEYATTPLHIVAVPQLKTENQSVARWLREQPPSIVAVLPDVRAPVVMALATTNRHRFVNGDAEILPTVTRALFNDLQTFPSAISVAALETVGVDLVVLDRRGYTAAAWAKLPARVEASAPMWVRVATLTDAIVYRVVRA